MPVSDIQYAPDFPQFFVDGCSAFEQLKPTGEVIRLSVATSTFNFSFENFDIYYSASVFQVILDVSFQ